MGVRKIVYLAEPNVKAKVLHSTHGGGGCCAVWCGTEIPSGSRAMLAGFDGGRSSSSDISALVNSKMAQALVPGAAYVGHDEPGGYNPQHTYLIPFEDLPADQVAVLLRLLKLWSYGTYERAFQETKKTFPGLSSEDAAVVAVYVSTGNPYDDGYTTFYANTGTEGGYRAGPVKHGRNRMGGLLKLLCGEINQGVQKEFKRSGYSKAAHVPSLYNKGGKFQDAHWTVCHPVCIRSDQGPILESRGYMDNIRSLRNWVEKDGIDLVGASGKAQGPQTEEAPLSLGDAVASAPAAPKQARDSSGRFTRTTSSVSPSSSTSPSSSRSLAAPSRIPSRYSEAHKEQLRANRRQYVAGIYGEDEYRRIINQVKSHYQ